MTKRYFITLALIGYTLIAFGQQKIEWSSDYKLKPEDFKGMAPNTGTQTVYLNSLIEYGFVNYQLLFSNLNSNVTCSFLPSASWLDKGDNSGPLLRYAQVNWNLYELAARKLRKLFIENRMTLNANKMTEYHNQAMTDVAAIQSQYSKETEFGSIEDKQVEWEQKVQVLLSEYADFCKTCKPPKRKNKKAE